MKKFLSERKRFSDYIENNPVLNKDNNRSKVSGRRLEKRIDLHGKNRCQAREIVSAQLKSSKSERVGKIVFICGRGTHSENGGVLEDEVREALSQMKNYFKNVESDLFGNITVVLEEI